MREGPKTAVALKYENNNAPKITAKGSGHIAQQILNIADKHDVHIHEDPILASTLAQLNLDQEVPEKLYKVIAEVIAFAYLLADKYPENWVKDLKELIPIQHQE
jgi:flagellar biosynthesis protein